MRLFLFSFCTALSSAAFAEEPASPFPNEFVAENLQTRHDYGRFLYEAARSGEFDTVQVFHRWVQVLPDGGQEDRSAAFKLRAVEEKSVCFSTDDAPLSALDSSDATVLFQPADIYEHEYVKGNCVLRLPINTPNTNVKLSYSGRDYILETSGESKRSVRFEKLDEAWALFGLTRPEAYDLNRFSRTGRREDTVSEDALIEAVETGGRPLRAALNVLANRQGVKPLQCRPFGIARTARKRSDGKNACQTSSFQETPPSERLIDALLASDALLNDNLRSTAIDAFVAIGSTPRDNLVMGQLFTSLRRPQPESRNDVEIAWRKRVETRLGGKVFSDTTGEPFFTSPGVMGHAAKLALRLNETARTRFALEFEEAIRNLVLRELVLSQDMVELSAHAPYRDALVTDLLAKAEKDQKTPPVMQDRIEMLLVFGPDLSDALKQDLYKRCQDPASLVPKGDQERARTFCNGLDLNT